MEAEPPAMYSQAEPGRLRLRLRYQQNWLIGYWLLVNWLLVIGYWLLEAEPSGMYSQAEPGRLRLRLRYQQTRLRYQQITANN